VVFLNNRQRQKAHQYLHVLLPGAQKPENTGQSGQGGSYQLRCRSQHV